MKHIDTSNNQDQLLLNHLEYLVKEGFIEFLFLRTNHDPCYLNQTLFCKFVGKTLEELAYFYETIKDFNYVIEVCDKEGRFCITYHDVKPESVLCIHSLKDYIDHWGFDDILIQSEIMDAFKTMLETHRELSVAPMFKS